MATGVMRPLARPGRCTGPVICYGLLGGCTFNVDDLIASAGPDYVVPEMLPGVTCRQCGGALKFKLAKMPPEE